MKWPPYQMRTRDRVVCLLLFILLWLIAIGCEPAEGATRARAETVPRAVPAPAMLTEIGNHTQSKRLRRSINHHQRLRGRDTHE